MSEVLLNEVCELIVDCPHSTANDEGKGYPLVRTPNIGKGRLVYNGMHRVCEDVYNKRNARAVPQENDLIFAREATAGNVALIQKGEKVCLGQRTVLIRPNQEMVNPAFLTYFLLAPKQQYNLLSTANGATVAHVNLPTIRNLKLDLPPLTIQHHIATILSRYDSLIENYQKQIKLLEEAAQRLYKEWFVDLHFPGHENTKIVDGVPEGWEKKKLGDLFSFVRGKSYTSKELSDDGTIMVNLKNIQAFGGYKSDVEKHFLGSFKEEQTLVKGDLVMGVTDMTQERRLVGSVALIPDFNETATFSMDLIKLVSHTLPNVYLYCAMRYGDISRQIAPLANGVNVLHLKPESINNIEMLVGSESIIDKFARYTSKTIETILSLQSQIRLLTEIRDRLLPKLMNGEL
ncbi:MAG: restriction endonuclease subunit S [Bacteroidaceae bacterium]|nr:restriction endonuclease subunit S [Bacteroidaceae bacterium]